MRPGGKEGKSYHVTLGPEIVGDGVATVGEAGIYQVLAIGEPTALPGKEDDIVGGVTLGVGDILFLSAVFAPAAGDTVRLFGLTKLGFARDVDTSRSRQKFDNSTQEDVERGVKAFVVSNLTETTGSVSGYLDVDSAAQRELEAFFGSVLEQDAAGKVTRRPTNPGLFHFLLSRRESTEVGEVEVWEYKPMIVDQLQQKKPLEGVQEFNFNYTVDGAAHPAVLRRVVTL